MGAIEPAVFPADLTAVRALWKEYEADIGIDLAFQEFDRELATLPGEYSPPGGLILLAKHPGETVGCTALRPLGSGDCEMKRLYVRPAFRRLGLGRRLVESVIEFARRSGHERMYLDTLPSMEAAQNLYRSFGFEETGTYRFNPIPGAVFFVLRLSQPGRRRKRPD